MVAVPSGREHFIDDAVFAPTFERGCLITLVLAGTAEQQKPTLQRQQVAALVASRWSRKFHAEPPGTS
jgi:hypothetical protein